MTAFVVDCHIVVERRIDAARALAMGLVGEVVPAAELDAAIARLTEQLVSCAPDAQKAAKDINLKALKK